MALSRSSIFLLPLIAVSIAGAASCGARTTLPERVVAVNGTGGGGGSGGGTGGDPATTSSTATTTTTSTTVSSSVTSTSTSTGTGGGPVMNPVISDVPSSFLQSETSVVAGSNGFVVVAWIDITQQGGGSIGYAFSTDGGQSFTTPDYETTPLPGMFAQASDPVVTVDAANNFYLSWVGYQINPQSMQPTNMHAYVAKAIAGTTTFGAPVAASKTGGANDLLDKPWITVDNTGTLILTYLAATQVSVTLTAARSTDGGATWQQSDIAKDAASERNLAFPCVPKNGNRIWVTYVLVDPSNKASIGLSWSDDHGVTWAPLIKNTVVNLAGEAVAFDDPNCVAEGNDVWISYGLSKDPVGDQDSARLFGIRLAHSGDGGATIDSRFDVADPQAAPLYQHPQMAREDSGALDFTYYAGLDDQDPDGSFRRSRWVAGQLSPSVAVESPIDFVTSRQDPRWLGDYTGLYWRSNVLYTSYAVNTSGVSHIAFARAKTP